MHADMVYYDEHAPYPYVPPGRRKEKPAGRFILRTHIENSTPYRTSDLVAIVHAVARQFTDDANDMTVLNIASGGTSPTRFGYRHNKVHGYVWLEGVGSTTNDVVHRVLKVYADYKPETRAKFEDLRERTKTLRAILKRTGKIELRRRRGKR